MPPSTDGAQLIHLVSQPRTELNQSQVITSKLYILLELNKTSEIELSLDRNIA